MLLGISDSPMGTLSIEIRDANGNLMPTGTVLFESSNPKVATVSNTGLVTAIAPPADFWSTPYITIDTPFNKNTGEIELRNEPIVAHV